MRKLFSIANFLQPKKNRVLSNHVRSSARKLSIQHLETRRVLSASIPDSYEPNDSIQTAKFLDAAPGTTLRSELTIHSASDRDFFRITTNGVGTSSHDILVTFTHSVGNLDARLYDAIGNLLVSSTGSINDESLSLQGLPAGTYFIEVYGFSGSRNTYRLTFDTPVFVPPDQPDRFETNNSFLTATDLQTRSGSSLISDLSTHTNSDRDFYSFTVSSFGTSAHYVDVLFTNTNGNIDARLLDSTGATLITSNGSSNTERLSLDGLSQGTYFIEIFASPGARNRYSLIFEGPTFASADRFEANNTISTGTNLQAISGTSTVSNLSIHSNADRDFYKFTTSGIGTSAHYVEVRFSQTDGDLDARLLNFSGVPLANASSVLNKERLSLQGLASGTYYIEVFGYLGARNNYQLYFDTPAPVLADRFEANDTRQTATDLLTLAGTATVPTLSIHTGTNRDFYKFTTTSTGTSSHYVDVLFSHANGDLNANLLDASGTTLITSTGSADNERLSLRGLSPGSYFVEVFGQAGAQNVYSLSFETPTPPIADRFESNDTLVTATDLKMLSGSSELTELSIHSTSDRDLYKFTTSGFGTSAHYIDLLFAQVDGDLDFNLIDSSGTTLATSSGVSSTERISLNGKGAGTYFIEIFGHKGARNRYKLAFETPQPVVADRLEANDTLQAATDLRMILGSLKLADLSITSDNRDFFRFEIGSTATASHSIQASFVHAAGNIDLRLLDSQGNVVRSSLGTMDNERISLSGLSAGVYFVEVFGDSSPIANIYSLDFATPSNQPSAADAWTIMVYITADDLAAAAFEDINEMELAVSRLPGTVNISVYWDQSSRLPTYPTGGGSQAAWGTVGRAFIASDNNPRSIATSFELFPEANTGNPQTLVDFVNWSTINAPAQRYGLILWDHGSGLRGSNFDTRDHGQEPDYLTTQELVQALSTLRMSEKRMDLLSFDACLMAMTEVGYSIRDLASTFVAAQELVDGDGHDYTTLLRQLESDPYNIPPATLATGFVRSFSDQYIGRSDYDTQSAINAAAYSNVITSLASFTAAAKGATRTERTAMSSARDVTAFYKEDYLRDLGGFMRRIAVNSSISQAIRSAATEVLNAVSQAVISKTADWRSSSGMSIFLPVLGSQIPSWYMEQYGAFDTATGWSEFIQASTDSGRNVRGDWAGSTNSLAARAFDLGAVYGSGILFDYLSLENATDVDWFRFTLNQATDSTHRVLTESNDIGNRISLQLYDVTGSNMIRDVSNEAHTISLAGLSAGQYLLRVAADEATERYSLSFYTPSEQLESIVPNISPQKAIQWGVISSDRLFSGVVPRNTHLDNDWAYFQFNTAPIVDRQNLRFTVNTSPSLPLRVEILGASSDPVEFGSGIGSVSVLLTPTGSGESYTIRVRQNPDPIATSVASINVRVEDLNTFNPPQAPKDIILSNFSVGENEEPGTLVGNLSAMDPNPSEEFTFSLVPGFGSNDNGSFIINGSNLATNSRFDFEVKSSYQIRVRVSDSFGLILEKPFTISVGDIEEPNAQNPINRFDVNDDGFVSPIDVLVVINLLNRVGSSIPIGQLTEIPPYVNVDGDNTISPLDVLQLINHINSSSGGEGEWSKWSDSDTFVLSPINRKPRSLKQIEQSLLDPNPEEMNNTKIFDIDRFFIRFDHLG
jgi:hypothetical protein